MEDRRPKDAATGDAEFEFGCLTPGSPTNYLADQLFSNGRFVLHDFPIQPRKSTSPKLSNFSRSVSRTSSISSKDSLSLMSSRSNSTNSSSSSCSSARTSTSEASSEMNLLSQTKSARDLRNPARNTRGASGQFRTAKQHGAYNYTQRWQFIAPVPVLNHQTSSSRRKNAREGETPDKKETKKKPAAEGLWRRFFRWFVSTCKECHAMEPSRKGNVFKGNMDFH